MGTVLMGERFTTIPETVEVMFCDGSWGNLHLIAAWVTQKGGHCNVESGYDYQGPDFLVIAQGENGDVVRVMKDWAVVSTRFGIVAMKNDDFLATHVAEPKQGP